MNLIVKAVAGVIYRAVQSLGYWLQFWLFSKVSRSSRFYCGKGRKIKKSSSWNTKETFNIHFKVKPEKVLLFMPIGPFYKTAALHLPSPFDVFASMFWLKAEVEQWVKAHTHRKKSLNIFHGQRGVGVCTEDRELFNLKCGESKTSRAHL